MSQENKWIKEIKSENEQLLKDGSVVNTILSRLKILEKRVSHSFERIDAQTSSAGISRMEIKEARQDNAEIEKLAQSRHLRLRDQVEANTEAIKGLAGIIQTQTKTQEQILETIKLLKEAM